MEFELFYNDHRKRSWGRWHINTGGDDWFESKKKAQKQIDDIQSALILQELLKETVNTVIDLDTHNLLKYLIDKAKEESEKHA